MFGFKSKSDTLKIPKKKNININSFLSFRKHQILNSHDWVNLVLKKFRNKTLIIRSSVLDEDRISGSNAGKYDSIKIDVINSKNLINSSKKIIKKLNLMMIKLFSKNF